ncbi:MAG: SprT family zinc-dependent metalloprotease [Bacteroidota bacterium]|nr:SprT family zinc-dependent metalloprotease [Bacteroidota bacterium]
MADNVYHFKAIGDVVIEKNNRAKTLRIVVKPNSGVRVTIPRGVTINKALRFVEEKTDWIRKSLEKVKTYEQNKTIFKPGIDFSTFEHKLEFENQPDATLSAKVGKGVIRIIYASELQLEVESGQEFIKKAVEYALRKEAKKHLPVRLAHLASKHGFRYADIRVKNLKTRWGSCSAVNNINLNIHLMRLPEYLIDYVILHELVHTVHKNHGPHFWKRLDEVSGNAKGLAKEMKNYRTLVY